MASATTVATAAGHDHRQPAFAGEAEQPPPPVRISRVAGRYLIFDIGDLMRLRRHRDLAPVLAGTIPQNPQQNGFMGLPAELMDEEAAVLVARGLARVVDDGDFHTRLLRLLSGGDEATSPPAAAAAAVSDARREYLAAIKGEGARARDEAAELARLNKLRSLEQAASKKKRKGGGAKPAAADEADGSGLLPDGPPSDPGSAALAAAARDPAPAAAPWPVTPTTSGALLGVDLLPPPSAASAAAVVDVNVPRPSPLQSHLHGRGYYMMPGLRFGCDYNVYPGDPLRFHSHFQATAYGWDEPITMLDLVGGGRLGTGVKKGFLIGGAVDDVDVDVDVGRQQRGESQGGPEDEQVRTFTIEWAGM